MSGNVTVRVAAAAAGRAAKGVVLLMSLVLITSCGIAGSQAEVPPESAPGDEPRFMITDEPTSPPGSFGASLGRPQVYRTVQEKEQRVLADAAAVQPLLDTFWANTLVQQNVRFEPPARFEYYRTTGNSSCGLDARPLPQNAYYCPAGADRYVAFDLDWFSSYLDAHPGNATTFLILSHEWGHAVQDSWIEQQPGVDVWDPPFRKELNADCLAGVFWVSSLADGSIIEEEGDGQAIYQWLFESGSGEWFNPGDHGTPEQRQLAFSDGFTHGLDHCRRVY